MSTQDQLDGKRRRVSRACDTCRRKKVRCDGLQPSCTNCTTFGFQCTFNDSAKKRGPPKGYIEALENRLHRMENLLGGLVQGGDRSKFDLDSWKEEQEDLESFDSAWPPSPDTPLFMSNLPSLPTPANGQLERNDFTPSTSAKLPLHNGQGPDEEDEDEVLPFDLEAREKINAIADNLSSLTLDDGGFVRYLGNSSGIDMLQKNQLLKNGYMMVPMRLKEHMAWLTQKEDAIARMESHMPLPPRDLADHLIDCYFTFIHPYMPVLHKPTFMRQYRNADPHMRPPGVLMNAMFAIASRYSTHPEIVGTDPESFGDEYFDRAKRLIDYEYELPRQSSIQALLLMTIYRFTSAKSGGRIWVLLGMAIRMAQDMGMHRSSARWHLPPLETELRKRLWWACYVMDRWSSCCMGRPLGIDDIDCDVDYPSVVEEDWADADGKAGSPDEDNENHKKELSFALRYFVENIKLAQIVGQILQRVYSATTRSHGPGQVMSTVAELDTKLTKWLLDLPADLKYDHKIEPSKLNRSVAAIHCSYYTILIVLHRPFMVPSALTKSKLSESIPSLNICVSAANSVTHLIERLIQDDSFQFNWCFATYEAFTTSLIHLTNSASIDMRLQTQARKSLVKMIAFMKTLGTRWWNAAKFAMVLEDLMCAHLNFDEYRAEGRALEPVVVDAVKDSQECYPIPIILRDQTHPSGGTLLFAPKVMGPQTPSSTSSTPSTSPSTPSIHNPDLQEIKQEPGLTDHGPLRASNHDEYKAQPTLPVSKSKKARKTTTNRGSLLPQSSAIAGSSVGAFDQQPFTFASLSIPGMFTQGQAFVGYEQMPNQNQQQQAQNSAQQSGQFQQQQQSQQPSQPFSVTPLFSSPMALQEHSAQQQQHQDMDQLQMQQQQEQQQLQQQQQHYLQQQQQFLQQHQMNMCLQDQHKTLLQQQQQQQQQQQRPGSQGSSHGAMGQSAQNSSGTSAFGSGALQSTPSHGSSDGCSDSRLSGTTATTASSTPMASTEDYSNVSLFPPQAMDQNPNLAAVPNPFFGIPQTIDWDEWNQYIASAGLQKF